MFQRGVRLHNHLKSGDRKREEKMGDLVRDTTFRGTRFSFSSGFEGVQAVPARSSGRGMLERG
jgi:hypothetical protein